MDHFESLYDNYVANDQWSSVTSGTEAEDWAKNLEEDEPKFEQLFDLLRFLSDPAVLFVDGYDKPFLKIDGLDSDGAGDACAFGIVSPYAEGQIEVSGGVAWVYDATVGAEGEIDASGTVSAYIVGGSFSGTIKATTAGVVRVGYATLEEGGEILVDGSGHADDASDIFIAEVINKGNITVLGGNEVEGAVITVYDVVNDDSGTITVTGDNTIRLNSGSSSGEITVDGGRFIVDNVVNSGTITVSYADITGSMLGNTGVITLECCTGTLSVPAGYSEASLVNECDDADGPAEGLTITTHTNSANDDDTVIEEFIASQIVANSDLTEEQATAIIEELSESLELPDDFDFSEIFENDVVVDALAEAGVSVAEIAAMDAAVESVDFDELADSDGSGVPDTSAGDVVQPAFAVVCAFLAAGVL